MSQHRPQPSTMFARIIIPLVLVAIAIIMLITVATSDGAAPNVEQAATLRG